MLASEKQLKDSYLLKDEWSDDIACLPDITSHNTYLTLQAHTLKT